MKTRILIGIVICAIAGVSIWYYINPPASAPADKPAPAKAVAVQTPAPAAKPATIEAPKRAPVAPAAAPVVTIAPQSAAVARADMSAPEAKADLKECITQTLKLLEAKDVTALIKTLMPPTAVRQMIESGRASSIEDIAAQYSQRPDINEKMTQLQQALESIKDLSPELSADGQSAVYKLAPSVTGPDGPTNKGDLTFVLVEGNWYLR